MGSPQDSYHCTQPHLQPCKPALAFTRSFSQYNQREGPPASRKNPTYPQMKPPKWIRQAGRELACGIWLENGNRLLACFEKPIKFHWIIQSLPCFSQSDLSSMIPFRSFQLSNPQEESHPLQAFLQSWVGMKMSLSDQLRFHFIFFQHTTGKSTGVRECALSTSSCCFFNYFTEVWLTYLSSWIQRIWHATLLFWV